MAALEDCEVEESPEAAAGEAGASEEPTSASTADGAGDDECNTGQENTGREGAKAQVTVGVDASCPTEDDVARDDAEAPGRGVSAQSGGDADPPQEASTSYDSALSPPGRELKALTANYPLNDSQVKHLMELINKCSPHDLTKLGLTAPVPAKPPKHLEKVSVTERLEAIQEVISSYKYNHTTQNFFNINKDRPFSRIMDTARDIMRDALPIRCVEGAFLGMYLTCGQEDLDRLALRFKTSAGGRVYRHIVLAVHHRPSKTWGALGLSRRKELMYKQMGYDSLSALVTDFKESYEGWWHKVEKIRVGLPAEHNVYYNGRINFCHVVARPKTKTWEHWCQLLDEHASKMRRSLELWRQLGSEAGEMSPYRYLAKREADRQTERRMEGKPGKEAAAFEAYRKASLWNSKGSVQGNKKKGKGKKKGRKGATRVPKVSDDGSLASTLPDSADIGGRQEAEAENDNGDGAAEINNGDGAAENGNEEEEEGQDEAREGEEEDDAEDSDDSEEEEMDVGGDGDIGEGNWQATSLPPGDEQVEVADSDDHSHGRV